MDNGYFGCKTCIKAVYNIWDKSEVTPRGQWIILITDKGLVFSIVIQVADLDKKACVDLYGLCTFFACVHRIHKNL